MLIAGFIRDEACYRLGLSLIEPVVMVVVLVGGGALYPEVYNRIGDSSCNVLR